MHAKNHLFVIVTFSWGQNSLAFLAFFWPYKIFILCLFELLVLTKAPC